MQAVIELGGHQYRVSAGDTIVIDDPGTDEPTARVLMTADKGKVVTGPKADAATVTLKVTRRFNERLPRVMRFRPKQGGSSKRTIGHRRHRAEVRVEKITAQA